jgi:hypothetical protein
MRRQPWAHRAWAGLYKRATLEFDPPTLSARINQARSAINARISETEDIGEQAALKEALDVLLVLETPDTKKAMY